MNWFENAKLRKKAQLVGGKIRLNAKEQQIFTLLVQVAQKAGVTLRAAGGWVRDKALGKESHDIDIAIDRMTGEQFARVLEPYIGERAHIIEENPEQSKHLATATVKVFGQPIDFVNLRDESFGGAYDEGSRILKENRFGTPQVDAERRDFTINALFYNLHTGQIEDYVGGMKDLGIDPDGVKRRPISIMTPLPPKKTFMDDPLRMLRGLRFMSKLQGAQLDPQVLASMQDPDVQHALATKVKPERIAMELIGGKELDPDGNASYKAGILNYPRATEALRLMHNTGLLDNILNVPRMKGFAPFTMNQQSKWHAQDLFTHTLDLMDRLRQSEHFQTLPPERQSLYLFSSLLHDLGKRDPGKTQTKPDGSRSYHEHELSSADVARQVCNKLRLSNEATTYVFNNVRYHMEPHAKGWGSKGAMRRFVNKLPDQWQDVINHARYDALASGTPRDPAEDQKYQQFMQTGHAVKNEVPQRPPLDGLLIQQMIPELTQGPWLGDLVKHLKEMRFDNPQLTEQDYMTEVMRQKPAILNNPAYAKFRRA